MSNTGASVEATFWVRPSRSAYQRHGVVTAFLQRDQPALVSTLPAAVGKRTRLTLPIYAAVGWSAKTLGRSACSSNLRALDRARRAPARRRSAPSFPSQLQTVKNAASIRVAHPDDPAIPG